jgi:hypothetical protein
MPGGRAWHVGCAASGRPNSVCFERQVELLGAPPVRVGRDAGQASVVGGEDRREDARRVEARAAVPVDRPVGAHERHRAGRRSVRARRSADSAPRCRPGSTGRYLPHAVRDAHRREGTSTSFPLSAELSSSSCARRASDSGRRSATTGWILPSRSSSSTAREAPAPARRPIKRRPGRPPTARRAQDVPDAERGPRVATGGPSRPAQARDQRAARALARAGVVAYPCPASRRAASSSRRTTSAWFGMRRRRSRTGIASPGWPDSRSERPRL